MGRSEDFRVVGKVVSTRVSRKGNIIMNLDQQYPNEIFSLFIRKEDLVNFPYDPIATWKNKMVVVKGKILNLSGTPTMYLSRDQQMREYGPSGK
jgi:endonuclease G